MSSTGRIALPPGEIVLASDNRGKLQELQALIGKRMEVVTQGALGVPAAHENGSTFVENALIKARNAATFTGLPAIADDSGLAVDFLGGEPGVRSARYAGEQATDDANNRRLLEALKGVPSERRSARFHCVVVLLLRAGDPAPLICSGAWDGYIVDQPRGDNGFGYDPLFFDPVMGRTAAELSPQEKGQVSHRAQALRALLECVA